LEAFGRQLEKLDLVPANTYYSLRDRGLNETIVRDVLGPQSDSEATEPGARLLMLAAEAHEAGIFSEGQLSDMLVMDRLELRRAMDAFASANAVDTIVETHA
jgi:hypothetical protein